MNMKRVMPVFFLTFMLITGCSTEKPQPQNNGFNAVACNLFYESMSGINYKTQNIRMENGTLIDTNEKWERGFIEAIPVAPAENLAHLLGYQDYIELQMAYGQLYQYNHYPVGEIFAFFGNYSGTDDYTIFIVNNNTAYKLELKESNYFFRSLKYNGNHLYLILSEYPKEEQIPYLDTIYAYEIELTAYTFKKYDLNIDSDALSSCKYFLMDNKRLYLANTINISETNADSIITVIDLETNQSHSIQKNGLASESILRIQGDIAVIYGKMFEGSPALPPYIEYYNEHLELINSKTLGINEEGYQLYLGDFSYHEGNLYCVLNNKMKPNCLFIIYNLNSDELLFKQEIKPPFNNSIMQKATFLLHDQNSGKYFNLS